MTCKILALVDSLGNLIKFRLMPGQYHDLVETKPLIEDVDFQALLADKAFDADWLIQERKHPANTALPSDPISLNLVPT